MAVVAELVARLRAETSELEKPLASARKEMSDFRKEVTSAGDALKKEMGGGTQSATNSLTALRREMAGATAGLRGDMERLQNQLGATTGGVNMFGAAVAGLRHPVTLAAAAVVGITTALVGTANALVDTVDRAQQLHAASGQTLGDATALARSFDSLGLSAQTYTATMGKVSAEIAGGADKLRMLGISARDSSGHVKTQGQVLLELHGRLGGVGTETDRLRTLTDLFGDTLGRELVPLFGLSKDKLEELIAAQQTMAPLTDAQIAAAREWARALAEAKVAWEGFTGPIGAWVASTGAAVLTWLTEAVKKQRELAASGGFYGGITLPPPFKGDPTGGEPPGGPKLPTPSQLLVVEQLTKQFELLKLSGPDQTIERMRRELAKMVEAAGPAKAEAQALVDRILALTRAQLDAAAAQRAAKVSTQELDAAFRDHAKHLLETARAWEELLQAQRIGSGRLDDLLAAPVMDQTFERTVARINAEFAVFGDEVERDRALAEALRSEIARLASLFEGRMTPQTQELTDKLNALRRFTGPLPEELGDVAEAVGLIGEATEANVTPAAQAVEQLRLRFVDIERDAALFGDRVDTLNARIDAQQQKVRLLADEHGLLSDEVRRASAELEGLYQFRDQQEMFRDIFGSAIGGINKFIEGLQLGTRTWKDFGTMALDVLRSITAEIVNRLLKMALSPLIDSLARAATVAVTGNPAAAAAAASGNGSGAVQDPMGEGALGNGGGSGMSMPSIPTGFFNPSSWGTIGGVASGLWGAAGGAGGTLGPAFTGVGGIDVLLAGGSIGDAASAFSAAAGTASTLSVALAGVGAAVAAFGSIMDLAGGNVEAGIGGLVGGAIGATAGAVLGSFVGAPWLGGFIGYALGDMLGSLVGGLFGGPSGYDIKRMEAGQEANEALGRVGGSYQAAAMSGDPAQVLAALQTGGGGAAGNSVRTELVLPSSLAGQIGISGQEIGDRVVAQWSSLTLEQFERVLAAMRENPDLIQLVRGSGDVPYLEGGDAAAVADQVKQAAIALLTSFTSLEEIRDKIRDLAADLGEAAQKVLPPELADRVADRFNDVRDRMLAVIASGIPVEEMQAQLQALEKELQSYVGLMALRATVEQDIAKMSGDFATQTRGAILGITTALDAANEAVEDARTRAGAAVGPEETLAANVALREAILGRYQLEVRLVQEIQAKIASLLQNVGAPAAANQIAGSVELLRQGDATAFNEVYLGFVNMARHAPTAAEKLFAIGQGIAAVIAAAPLNAEFLTNGFQITTTSGESIPDRIWQDLVTQAAPFMTELADMIGTAVANNDLEGAITLLQQEAQAIQALGAAAIGAVNQWADAAIEATNKAAAEAAKAINAQWDLEVKRINDAADLAVKGHEDAIKARELEIASNQKLIESIRRVAQEEQARIAQQVEGLQATQRGLLDAAGRVREFETVAKSFGDFVRGLEFETLRPEEQLASAQTRFDDLMAQASLGTTPQLLTDLQQAAQQLLGASGGDATIRASVLDQLRGVAGQVSSLPVTSADLEAQAGAIGQRIEALQKESKLIGERAAEQVERLEEINRHLADQNQLARDAITAINTQREQDLKIAEDNRKLDLEGVEQGRLRQIADIERVRDDTIDAIKKEVAEKLIENAQEQQRIMGTLVGAQTAQLNEITKGQPLQHFMAERAQDTVDELVLIKDKIDQFLGGEGHASGLYNVPAVGAYKLHPGEMVVPANQAEALRHAADTRGGSWQRFVDEAERLSAQRIHNILYGGGWVDGEWRARGLYVGQMAPVAAGEMTPEHQAIADRFLAQHSWLSQTQADDLRGDIARRMGHGPNDEGLTSTPVSRPRRRRRGGETSGEGGVQVLVAPKTTKIVLNGREIARALEEHWDAEYHASGGKGPIPGRFVRGDRTGV